MPNLEPEETIGCSRLNAVARECDWCGREIRFGNAELTICRNISQVDWDGDEETEVCIVIDSEVLVTLCAVCGNRINLEAVREVLAKTAH